MIKNISMQQKQFKSCFLSLLLIINTNSFGQPPARMHGIPTGAYSRYYRYFVPGNPPEMPRGSDLFNKGVFGIESSDLGDLTGFILRTFRTDNKVCACTYSTPGLQSNSHIPFTMYQNYIGRQSPENPRLNEVLSGTSSTLHAKVVYSTFMSSAPYISFTLALLDPAEFSGPYAQLPYTLSPQFPTDEDNPVSLFYSLHHPGSMTKRIADNLRYSSFTPPTNQAFYVYNNAFGNNNFAKGS